MTPNFFQTATLQKIWAEATLKNFRWHPIWVDFTGCRLNGQMTFVEVTIQKVYKPEGASDQFLI